VGILARCHEKFAHPFTWGGASITKCGFYHVLLQIDYTGKKPDYPISADGKVNLSLHYPGILQTTWGRNLTDQAFVEDKVNLYFIFVCSV
jgi:hypothetical protein